ncbi:MAG: extracellular solute-binding protein [Clostridiales bacterium]|nr:extracellular solute-binding protein [Clostridiales bacterium]
MKKVISLLMALAMIFALAACGGNAAPAATEAPKADAPAATDAPAAADAPKAEGITLKFQQWWGVELPEGYLQNIVDEYEAETGVKIELISAPWADTKTAITAGAANGTCEQVITAIRAGFTSVMIDASSQPYEGNVATCKKVCEAAHAVNVSVEGELGTIGNTDSVEITAPDQILYTDPQQAKDFIEKTGIDCLAIAIGTCHGIYPKDKKPELRIDILKEIKKVVSVPLVLHRGSSNKDEEIAKSVDNGVNKINISSDIKVAYYNKMREVLADASLREPNQIQPPCMAAMKEVCYDKIKLFKADGKAALY